MATYTSVAAGQRARAVHVQQIIDGITGVSNIAHSFYHNDASAWAVTVKNADTTNARALRVLAANGTDKLFYLDKLGGGFGNNTGAPTSHTSGNSDDDVYAVDFWYDAVHRRIHTRSALFVEVGDTPELGIRRAGGTYPNGPVAQTTTGETLGIIYFQGMHQSLGFQHRSVELAVKAVGNITTTSAGGELIISTIPTGSVTKTERLKIGDDGRLYFRDPLAANWLRTLDVDSSRHLNIAKDDTIADINFHGQVVFYDDASTPSQVVLINSNGLLPNDTDPPAANVLVQRSYARGWAYITVSGGAPTVTDSFNVSGVTDNGGSGDFSVNWDRDFADTNYAVVASPIDGSAGYVAMIHSKAVGSTRVQIRNLSGTLTDNISFCVIAFGLQ